MQAAAAAGKEFCRQSLQQPPRNAEQQTAFERFLGLCNRLFEICIEHNVALLPGSFVWQFIDLAKCFSLHLL